MTFAEAVKSVYSNYAKFDGRARRREYWYFALFAVVVYIIGVILVKALGAFFGIVLTIFWLGTLIPSIAVSVRRMHDTDHSGWWIICPIVPIVFALMDGTPGDNRFGPSPKGAAAPAAPPPPPAAPPPPPAAPPPPAPPV